MAKSTSPWWYFLGGVVIAYVLHGQIQGVVGSIKGTFSGRSAFYVPTSAFHVKTPRAGTQTLGWQRPEWRGRGHAYGRINNPWV